MKYKLPRQSCKLDLTTILTREIKKQELEVIALTKKHQAQLKEIGEIIATKGLPSYLVLQKLPHNLGHGIFLHPEAEPLPKGFLIAPYAGITELVPANYEGGHYAFTPIEKIYLSKEEQLFLDKNISYKPRRSYTLKVDALKKGNFTRFVNHSSSPNIEAELCRVPRKNSFDLETFPIEVIYFTAKKVRPGEQLLVCYEGEENCYWNEEGITPYPMTPQTFQLDNSLQVFEKIK